jgi:hypothetical protein
MKFFATATNGTFRLMSWSDLSTFAPQTKAVFESIGQQTRTPVIDVVPSYLGIVDCRFDLPSWAIELDRTDEINSVSNREVMLRYVLSRAIVDQGSDIEGVEMWHSRLLERCYAKGIRILHDPSDFVDNFAQILQMGVEIPGFRWSPVKFRYKNWAGLATHEDRHLYVNRGYGFIGFTGRVGIWPEITVLTLRKA